MEMSRKGTNFVQSAECCCDRGNKMAGTTQVRTTPITAISSIQTHFNGLHLGDLNCENTCINAHYSLQGITRDYTPS
jgi:hypothetical protein